MRVLCTLNAHIKVSATYLEESEGKEIIEHIINVHTPPGFHPGCVSARNIALQQQILTLHRLRTTNLY